MHLNIYICTAITRHDFARAHLSSNIRFMLADIRVVSNSMAAISETPNVFLTRLTLLGVGLKTISRLLATAFSTVSVDHSSAKVGLQ